MRGFAMLDIGKTGWIEKPDLAIKNPTDVLIKTTAVAHCTSDVHNVETGDFPSMIGNIIGHEAVGVIAEVGSEVKDFKVGDRVAIHDMSPYWGDYMTQKGMPNWSFGSSRTQNPELDGMFSEYILFERADTGLAHIPDNVTDIQALMATDMIPTAYTGINKLDIQFGETVAIIGIGPVGLCAIEGCILKGAAKVITVGHRTACKDVAKKMGASVVLDYADGPIVEQVLAANGGKQVDKVLLCVDYPEAISDAYQMCRFGGTICTVAGFQDASRFAGFLSLDKTLTGIVIQTGRYWLEGIMAMISEGRIHPELVVSHVYNGFDSIPEAFGRMCDKTDDLIKTVSVW